MWLHTWHVLSFFTLACLPVHVLFALQTALLFCYVMTLVQPNVCVLDKFVRIIAHFSPDTAHKTHMTDIYDEQSV